MKIHKLLLAGLFAFALTACSDDDPTPAPTPTPDQPEQPENPSKPDDNIKSPTPSFGLATQAMTLNTSKTYQEMEGFGASDCWLPNTLGTYWTSTRYDMAELLFSQTFDKEGNPRGIGLSMWRFNLGAGTAELGAESGINNDNEFNRAESFLTDGKYNWNKAAGQRFFMQQAKNMGVEKYVLFSNSPLVQFTKNGMGRSSGGSNANLKDDCYDDFAEYMAEVAKHFSDEGYNIAAISPVNEPQYSWDGDNQEGSPWQNSEVARLARELDKSLTSRGLSNTEILVAEAGDWTYLYEADRNKGRDNIIYDFFSTNSENYIGDLAHMNNLICGHSYWTYPSYDEMNNVRRKLGNAAAQKNLRVWQTEWSMLDAPPQGLDYTSSTDMELAMGMSQIMHSDLTLANVSSWSYWTAMSVANRWDHRIRFELINTIPAGGNVYDNNFRTEGTMESTRNLWVLGNYSLFVRPGYKRVDLSHKETKDFFASAYVSPNNNRVVVVVTNFNKNTGMLLNMKAPEGTKTVYRYTTTANKNMQRDQFNVRDDVFVDPASVTTIVYDL